MFTKELSRHLSEFKRAILGHKWEQHDNGILVPNAHAIVSGQYSFRVNKGAWSEPIPNLVPTEGLVFMLNLLGNQATVAAGYIALHANTTTPLATHTAASYTATFSEITSGSEGYSEATREVWTTAAATTVAAVHNNASPAEFTIVTASTLAVNGAALLTASAKGATTGKLVSTVAFAATRNFSNTDLFDVKYQIGLTAS